MFIIPRNLQSVWLLLSGTVITAVSGCMYQPPMYQQGPYGQPMYGAPGGYSQPGTMYIPPSNAAPYPPGSTYDVRPDDFRAAPGGTGTGTGTGTDDRFFREDGGTPLPRDPSSGGGTGSGTGSGSGTSGFGTGEEQFRRDLLP